MAGSSALLTLFKKQQWVKLNLFEVVILFVLGDNMQGFAIAKNITSHFLGIILL